MTRPVRKTESRLPDILKQDYYCLGRIASHGNYTLISFLDTPVTVGRRIDYVVFVENDAPVNKYQWNFTLEKTNGDKLKKIQESAYGFKEYIPNDAGILEVEVRIVSNGIVIADLKIRQVVIQRFKFFELLKKWNEEVLKTLPEDLEAWLSLCAYSGDEDIFEEVFYDLRKYIYDAASQNVNRITETPFDVVDIPIEYLSSLVYVLLLNQNRNRIEHLEEISTELNKEQIDSYEKLLKPIGISAISIATLAMLLDMIPWVEAKNESELKLLNNDLKASLKQNILSQEKIIDLFNLLRFPKSNIRLCAKLLSKLKNRKDRALNVGKEAFLNNTKMLNLITDEYIRGCMPYVIDANHHKAEVDISKFPRSPFIELIIQGLPTLCGKIILKRIGHPDIDLTGVKVIAYKKMLLLPQGKSMPVFEMPSSASKRLTTEHFPTSEKKYHILALFIQEDRNQNNVTDWVKIGFDDSKPLNGCGWVMVYNKNSTTLPVSFIYTGNKIAEVLTNQEGQFGIVVDQCGVYDIIVSPSDLSIPNIPKNLPFSRKLNLLATSDNESNYTDRIKVEVDYAERTVSEKEVLNTLKDFSGYTYKSKYKIYICNRDNSNNCDINDINDINDIKPILTNNNVYFKPTELVKVNPEQKKKIIWVNGEKKAKLIIDDNTYYTCIANSDDNNNNGNAYAYKAVQGYTHKKRYIVARFPSSNYITIKNSAGGSVPLRSQNPKQNDCTTFTFGLLANTFMNNFQSIEYISFINLKLWQIREPADHWGPLKVAIADELGIGRFTGNTGGIILLDKDTNYEYDPNGDINNIPLPWSLVQSWSKTDNFKNPGHSSIIVDIHLQTGRLLILDSNVKNASPGLNGPQFREINHIDNSWDEIQQKYIISRDWWKRENLTTWETLRREKYIGYVHLNINNLQLVY